MNLKYFSALSLSIALLCTGCQHQVFGVDETVWNTLNEQEREKVIEGYNKRQEIELAHRQKQREKELENERRRQELDAQTAPFYAAADVVSSLCGKSGVHSSLRIQSISTRFGKQTVTIGDEPFEVSVFSKMSQAWVKGQKVELTKNDRELLYPVQIKNLDNGETVHARKVL